MVNRKPGFIGFVIAAVVILALFAGSFNPALATIVRTLAINQSYVIVNLDALDQAATHYFYKPTTGWSALRYHKDLGYFELSTDEGSTWNRITTEDIDSDTSAHGSLTGLGDDDHTQYHNDTRGDARYYTETELDAGQLDNRYYTEAEHISTSAGAGDAGKPIKLDAAGHVDVTMINDPDISHLNIANIGSKSHATLDTEVGANTTHSTGAGSDHANVATNTTHSGLTNDPHSVTKAQVGLTNVEDLKVNLVATVAPTANDDSGSGYAVGSRWFDVTADKEYVCLDSTSTAAVWTETTAGDDANAIHDNVAAEISAITVKAFPASGDWFLIEDAADSNNKKKVDWASLPGAGGGETNTASNQGTDGVGVFDTKAGVDLQFRNIAPASGKVSVTLNGKDIDIDIPATTKYIPFEIRLGIPFTNLTVVDVRQGVDLTNWHLYLNRLALSGANTISSMFLPVQLPADFGEFYQGGDNIFINVLSSDRANNLIVLWVYDDTGDVDNGVNGADIEPGSDATWAEASDKITETDADYAAGDWVYIRVYVDLDIGDYYWIGEGYILYTTN